MTYKDIKNIHSGQKIIVCGLGKSLLTLEHPENYLTIGVNDIERKFVPNYLLVVNDKQSFLPERWKYIEGAQSPHVLTHIKTLAIKDPEKIVELKLGKYGGFDYRKESTDYSSNSPYMGCLIAGWMGASKIGLLGVDFTHDHFFKATGLHSLHRKINGINKEYMSLCQFMKSNGTELVNLSQESHIQIPKVRLEDF